MQKKHWTWTCLHFFAGYSATFCTRATSIGLDQGIKKKVYFLGLHKIARRKKKLFLFLEEIVLDGKTDLVLLVCNEAILVFSILSPQK